MYLLKLLFVLFHSLQLCASVQIPKVLGGLDAEALYVDTNTNFTLSRFRGKSITFLLGPTYQL